MLREDISLDKEVDVVCSSSVHFLWHLSGELGSKSLDPYQRYISHRMRLTPLGVMCEEAVQGTEGEELMLKGDSGTRMYWLLQLRDTTLNHMGLGISKGCFKKLSSSSSGH